MKTKHVLALLMAVTAACENQNNTMIVVEVWSDLSTLDTVRIDVTGPSASSSRNFPLSGSSKWPVHLALVPQDAKDARLMVMATALFDQNERVRQGAWVTFEPGKRKLLKLVLDHQCANAGCNRSQSCTGGVCSSVPSIASLPDYDPKAAVPGTGGAGNASSVVGQIGGRGGDGGSPPIGGAGGMGDTGGSVPYCTNGLICGGDVVGTWQVDSSCLTLSGDWDVTPGALGCKTVPVIGTMQVTGTWTARADGVYFDNTITKGSMTFPLAPDCLSVSRAYVPCHDMGYAFTTLGWKNTTCSQTGGVCSCKAETTLQGGLGVPSGWAWVDGEYAASGTTLSVDGIVDYSYCAQGSTLTLNPKPTVLPVQGNIVLRKS